MHDRAGSQPQRLGDTVWYVAHRHDPRIVDDRTGITAAPSQCPATVQVYAATATTGGLWRVTWTPIRVAGRHRGACRTDYR